MNDEKYNKKQSIVNKKKKYDKNLIKKRFI